MLRSLIVDGTLCQPNGVDILAAEFHETMVPTTSTEFTTTAGMRGGKSAESAVAALPKHVTESLRWLLFSDDCGVAGHEWV